MSEEEILHLKGIAVIEDDGGKARTTIMGARWHLHIEGQPAYLKNDDDVTVKVFLECGKGEEDESNPK